MSPIGWSPSHTRRFFFALLYFSEGAPIGYVWWALPTQLRADGIDLGSITLLSSLLAIPWALKALWAPVIDTYRSPHWGYRSWILAAQVCMGIALLPLAIVGPAAMLWLTVGCLLVHAFCAATQDVAIDALCISMLPADERGRANGWMQAGMLLGRAAFGGGTLMLLSALGPRGGVLLLIGVVWGIALLVSRSRTLAGEPSANPETPKGLQSIRAAFHVLVRQRIVWYAVGFAMLSGAVFEGLGSVVGPLFVDSGLTVEDSGYFFALPAIAAMTLGALVGGSISDTIGARRAVYGSFLALFGAVCVLSAGLVIGFIGPDRLIGSMTVVYAGIGLFTATSYTLYMESAVAEYRATSFSAYMGMTNLCESWSAASVGHVVPIMGYGGAFAVLAVISLGSLSFLRRLPASPAAGDA